MPEGLDYFLHFYIAGSCLSQESGHQFPIVLLHTLQQKVNLNVLRKFATCSVNMAFDTPFLKVSSQLVMYTCPATEHWNARNTVLNITQWAEFQSPALWLSDPLHPSWFQRPRPHDGLNTVKNTSPRAQESFPAEDSLAFWMLGLTGLWMWLSGMPGSPGSSCTLQSSSPAGAWHSEGQREERHSQGEQESVGCCILCNLNLTHTRGSTGTGGAQRQSAGLSAPCRKSPLLAPQPSLWILQSQISKDSL